jgi:hypothetical protein
MSVYLWQRKSTPKKPNLGTRIGTLLFLSLLISCTPDSGTTLVTPMASPSLTSTLKVPSTPTLTAAPTITPLPTCTPRPAEPVEFFRIRMEYVSNSPHSLLEINGKQVLTGRMMETQGEFSEATILCDTAGKKSVFLIRPDNADIQEPVSAVVDFAIAAESISVPFNFVVVTHTPYPARIKVSGVTDAGTIPLAEFTHVEEYDNYYVNLAPLKTIPPASRAIRRPERMLWAIYYPWFPDVGWDTKIADNPLAGETSSDSREDVALQIEQAQSAGIDGFLFSYTGDWEDRRVELLLEEADKHNFKIAVYVESADNPHQRMRPVETIRDWISHSIDEFAVHPSYAKVNGKPVFVEYMSRDIPLSDWTRAFESLGSDGHDGTHLAMGYNLGFLDVFTGFHEYSVLDAVLNPEQVYPSIRKAVTDYTLLADDEEPRIFAATVSPGFDAGPYDNGASPFVVERNDGDTYRRYFEAALAADADWIFITSWNEYGENTHIEPSIRYGDQYQRITREYAELWKEKK